MKDVNLLVSNGVDINSSLELFGDMETYDETLEEFLSGVSEKLSNIKKYKEASDMANYAILVHSLKSDSKYLGFTKLAELSFNHEMESKANNVSYVYENYDQLIDEANRIVLLVGKYLNKEVKPVTLEDNSLTVKDQTILVVDDSNLIRGFIRQVFDDSFEVKMANDGEEAIRIIEANQDKKIIGMLLDLNMPNVDGFGVLEYFSRNSLFSKIPVAIVTGEDNKDVIEKAYAYPIADVLSKPFNERDVKIVIDKIINFV